MADNSLVGKDVGIYNGVVNEISYDANGNLKDLARSTKTNNYNYYAGTNKVQNTDGVGSDYVYDSNGNITNSDNDDLEDFLYDPFTNMTMHLQKTHDLSIFTYGASNQRVLKNSEEGFNSSTAYIHGLNDFPLMEKTDDGLSEITKLYVYGPTGLIAVNDDDGWFFLLKDHLGSTRVVLNESNAWVENYDYMPFGGIMRSSVNPDISYKFTGQEFDPETGLHNFRARMYDSDLAMFFAVDPAGQGFSPFAYAGNNPIVYVDKDGKFFITTAILIGAAIGATINVASNLDNINNVGDFFGYLGVGAISGGVAGIGGPLAWAGAGFVSGFGNTGLQGGNIGQMLQNGAIGGVSGLAGGYAGKYASQHLGGFILNGFNVSANSAVGGLIFGGIGGAAGGYAGGFTAGYLGTGNFSAAHQMGMSGLQSGAFIGGSVGATSNIAQNLANDRHWFSGRPNNSVVIAQKMGRVNNMAKGIRSKTIETTPDDSWPEGLDARKDFKGAMRYNEHWIEKQMYQGKHIFNGGAHGTTPSPFYMMEQFRTQNYSRLLNLNEITRSIYYWRPWYE